MKNTILHFYEGLSGSGVVISVTYNQSRVIFDFGAPFHPDTNVYDGVVEHRNQRALTTALALKQIPAVPGVFPKADLWPLHLQSFEDSPLHTGIIISHLHLDHMSAIGMVHPDVPVYLHESALKLQDALEKIGEGLGKRNSFTSFQYHEPFLIQEIRITPFFSDHPCLGAASFLIQTPDANLFYTGDIRYHGLQREEAFAEIEQAAKTPIDLLLLDVTTSSPERFFYGEVAPELWQPGKDILPGMISEEAIYADIFAHLSDDPGIAFFNIYHRDMQLIEALIAGCAKINRTLVFEQKTAFVLKQVLGIAVPIVISDTGDYDSSLSGFEVIAKAEIKKNPQRYFVQNSYRNILELLDYPKGGLYYHLFGEPFGGKAYRIMENMVKRCNHRFFAFTNLFSFNHAYPNHLSWLIKTMKPKGIVGVHSSAPEKLDNRGYPQYFPKKDVDYIWRDGILKEV
ncbi:MAG: hypothetical protein LBR25_00215 [Erysipelotrichaceae bacterium]|jgi:ribonuclease J|nr:hypothetical protein [Erysipelotrichaceae bacterium]